MTAKRIIRNLEKIGFVRLRQKGSHVVMKHQDGRMIVVPDHAGEDIGPGLLSVIVAIAGISKKEFHSL